MSCVQRERGMAVRNCSLLNDDRAGKQPWREIIGTEQPLQLCAGRDLGRRVSLKRDVNVTSCACDSDKIYRDAKSENCLHCLHLEEKPRIEAVTLRPRLQRD